MFVIFSGIPRVLACANRGLIKCMSLKKFFTFRILSLQTLYVLLANRISQFGVENHDYNCNELIIFMSKSKGPIFRDSPFFPLRGKLLDQLIYSARSPEIKSWWDVIKAITELHKVSVIQSYKKRTTCYTYARQLFRENYARALRYTAIISLRESLYFAREEIRSHAPTQVNACKVNFMSTCNALHPGTVVQLTGDLRSSRESILFRRGSRPCNQMIRFTY